MSLCRSAVISQRTTPAFRMTLAASLFFTVMVALPAFAQQEAPPDAVSEADEAQEDDAKPETDSSGAEATATDTEPTDFPVDEPETAVPVPDEDIEEILVQGSSQATKLDEPISIVRFGVEQMRAEGIRDIRDLANFTPSLEIKTLFAATNATIFIRGVGLDDFNANAVSAVAIYQDDIYMNSPSGQLFGFFDLENVEVLRGPQGTLYRNASAGAILVHSRRPTDEFEAYLTHSYGRFNEITLEGAIGGPIIPDLLAGRISGTWGIRDGITKNRCGGMSAEELLALDDLDPCGQVGFDENGDPVPRVEPFLDSYTNDIDGWAARGQLLLTVPPELADMDWLLNVHGGQNRSRALQYQASGVKFDKVNPEDPDVLLPLLPIRGLACPEGQGGPLALCKDDSGYRDVDGDPYAGDYDIDGPEDLDLFGASLVGNWRFLDDYQLKSVTGFEWHDRFTHENTDGGPRFKLNSFYIDTAWQVSQEFKLEREWPQSDFGDGSWAVGAFYIQEDLEVSNEFDNQGGIDLLQAYTQKMRNGAAYVYSDYKLQPGCEPIPCDFTLITGLRYNLVYKKFDISTCGGPEIQRQCLTTLAGTANSTRDGLSGELSLAWHFYEDNSFYLKYSRGWKGGHFNGGASGRFDLITGVEPEIVDSFEAGIRSNWFDGRLMFNATGFYYDYQDLQVFQLLPTPLGFPVTGLVNANDAVVYGAEMDLAAEPLPGLNITLNGSWVETEYLDFVVGIPFQTRTPNPTPGQPPVTRNFLKEFDYTGNNLIAAPRFSMTTSISYEIPLPGHIGTRGLGFLIPRFSTSWKDDIFHDASGGRGVRVNFPKGTFGQKSHWIHNASLGWRSENDGVELMGWVRNFLDETITIQSTDLSLGFAVILDAYNDPRTYGLTVTFTF